MQITFPMQDILELAAWNAKHTQAPSYDELFDAQYYPGGDLAEDENGWPDSSKILTERLPRSLHLVKDQGLYLMAGTVERFPSKDGHPQRSHVVYADGCHPERDPNFYERSRAAFGGDDGVCSIPVDWVHESLKANPNAKFFMLEVTPECIGLLVDVPKRRVDPAGPSL